MAKLKKAVAGDTAATKQRPVIVCTTYRGVFFGYASDTRGDRVDLTRARMCIYWGTTNGVFQLAETGPTAKTKLSSRADIDVRSVTSVLEVTASAAEAFEHAP